MDGRGFVLEAGHLELLEDQLAVARGGVVRAVHAAGVKREDGCLLLLWLWLLLLGVWVLWRFWLGNGRLTTLLDNRSLLDANQTYTLLIAFILPLNERIQRQYLLDLLVPQPQPLHIFERPLQVQIHALTQLLDLARRQLQIRPLLPQSQALIVEFTLHFVDHLVEVLRFLLEIVHNFLAFARRLGREVIHHGVEECLLLPQGVYLRLQVVDDRVGDTSVRLRTARTVRLVALISVLSSSMLS